MTQEPGGRRGRWGRGGGRPEEGPSDEELGWLADLRDAKEAGGDLTAPGSPPTSGGRRARRTDERPATPPPSTEDSGSGATEHVGRRRRVTGGQPTPRVAPDQPAAPAVTPGLSGSFGSPVASGPSGGGLTGGGLTGGGPTAGAGTGGGRLGRRARDTGERPAEQPRPAALGQQGPATPPRQPVTRDSPAWHEFTGETPRVGNASAPRPADLWGTPEPRTGDAYGGGSGARPAPSPANDETAIRPPIGNPTDATEVGRIEALRDPRGEPTTSGGAPLIASRPTGRPPVMPGPAAPPPVRPPASGPGSLAGPIAPTAPAGSGGPGGLGGPGGISAPGGMGAPGGGGGPGGKPGGPHGPGGPGDPGGPHAPGGPNPPGGRDGAAGTGRPGPARAGSGASAGTGGERVNRAALRQVARNAQRVRAFAIAAMALIILGAPVGYLWVTTVTRDPVMHALDSLPLPDWSAKNPADAVSGSRWCIKECRFRDRTWQSERGPDDTQLAYVAALTKEGWRPRAEGTCPTYDDGIASCWHRDEYVLDLWIRAPICEPTRPTAAAATKGTESVASPAEGGAEACPGSLATVKVYNALSYPAGAEG